MQKYRAFLETAACGSFTKAARRLGYTQSGISRMIASLEAELGLSLFVRRHGFVELTSEGRSLLPHIASLNREADLLAEQVESLKGLETGTIRIGTFTSVATHWIPRIIAAFRNDYPGIEYELRLGDYREIEAWLMDGTVDCGFVRLPTKPELKTEYLVDDEFLVIVPANHPLANEKRFPVSQLAAYPFMELSNGTVSDVAFIFEEHSIDLHPVCSTWDDYAIMSMVESGLGIAILPSLVLKRIPFNIKALPLDKPAFRSIALATRSTTRKSLAVERFLEYVRKR